MPDPDDTVLVEECLDSVQKLRKMALDLGMPSLDSKRKRKKSLSGDPSSWLKRQWSAYVDHAGLDRRDSFSEGPNRDEVLGSLKRIPTEYSLLNLVLSFKEEVTALAKLLIRCERKTSDYAINECLSDTRVVVDFGTWYITLRSAFHPKILAHVSNCVASPASNQAIDLQSLFRTGDSSLDLSCLATWDSLPIKIYSQPLKLLQVRDTMCGAILDALSLMIQNIKSEKVLNMILSNNLINEILKNSHDIVPDARILTRLCVPRGMPKKRSDSHRLCDKLNDETPPIAHSLSIHKKLSLEGGSTDVTQRSDDVSDKIIDVSLSPAGEMNHTFDHGKMSPAPQIETAIKKSASWPAAKAADPEDWKDLCGRTNFDLVSSMVSFSKALSMKLDKSNIFLLLTGPFDNALLRSLYLLIDYTDQIIASHCRNAIMHLVGVALEASVATAKPGSYWEEVAELLSFPIDADSDHPTAMTLVKGIAFSTALRIKDFDENMLNSSPRTLLDGINQDQQPAPRIPAQTPRAQSFEEYWKTEEDICNINSDSETERWAETPRRPVIQSVEVGDSLHNAKNSMYRTTDFLDFVNEFFHLILPSKERQNAEPNPVDLRGAFEWGEEFVREALQYFIHASVIQLTDQMISPQFKQPGTSLREADYRSCFALDALDQSVPSHFALPNISPLVMLRILAITIKTSPIVIRKPVLKCVFVSLDELKDLPPPEAPAAVASTIKPRLTDSEWKNLLK